MEEEEKIDYRQHLINTLDQLIDSGISVYDLDVVNKKAIKSNYIPKQVVRDAIDLHKDYILNQATTSNPTLDRHFRDKENYVVNVLLKILKGEK